ncbi:G2/M phase-specific E3 ubiquitin-protein ligase-like isoform X2 [Misgurnus anguillicaudatus]
MVLLQAGLGRRTISVPEEANHAEISSLFCEVFPKLRELDGAWMIYKAAGGSGQRSLTVVSPDAEGYTGLNIIKAAGGKACLYIMPIQHKLDTSPLPLSAKEFESMPKANCITCQAYVPIQLLAFHVAECKQNSIHNCEIISDDDSSLESTIHDFDKDAVSNEPPAVSTSIADVKGSLNELPTVSPSVEDTKVACPVCLDLFSRDYVELHASSCGVSLVEEFEKLLESEVADKVVEKMREKPCKSLSDILTELADCVDHTSTFNVSVTREGLYERSMLQWKRQKNSSPKNILSINFLGEYGIDSGALRKEFLTEMLRGIESHLFEGGNTGKAPKYSITDYMNDNFKTCGEIFAVSVAQGGPPPNFFKKWCYDYICSGTINKEEMSKDNVTDPELIELIEQIDAADTNSITNLSERILASGYSGPIIHERKAAIIDAIVLHSAVRIIPVLQQICDGLRLYGFHNLLTHHSDTCLQLFVPGHLKKVDAEFLELALAPVFSVEGSLRRHTECRIINFLQDFIQKLEDEEELATPEKKGTSNTSNCITVGSFLQWLTGQAHIPLIASQREGFKIHIDFDHDCNVRYGNHNICYPVVNACATSITFPTKHIATYQEFQDIISEAINGSQEFGRH